MDEKQTGKWRTYSGCQRSMAVPNACGRFGYGMQTNVGKRIKGKFHIDGKDYITPYDIAIRPAKIFELD